MNPKIWTPRYVKNRIRLAIRQKLYKEHPWLVLDSVNFMENYLKPQDRGLEWGCGRSTVWFAKRIGVLTSVETDKTWHGLVSSKLADAELVNVDLHLVSKDDPEEYLKPASVLAYESLDFVLVDGQHRHLAVTTSLPLLKKGGILIIDNINWYIPSPFGFAPASVKDVLPEWSGVFSLLKSWRCFWATDGVTDTAIWFKP